MHIGIAGPIEASLLNKLLPSNCAPLPGGMGGVAVNHLIEELIKAGHKVSVFGLNPHVIDPIVIKTEKLDIYIGPYRNRARYRMKDFFLEERKFLVRTILETNIDIIHAHWAYEFAWAAIDTGLPHLITCHDSPLKVLLQYNNLYRFEKFLMAFITLRNSYHITAVSPYIKREIKWMVKKPVSVIPNLVPSDWFDIPLQFKKGNIRSIACINNGWSKLKNPESAIRSFSKLRRQNNELEIFLYGKDFGINEKAYCWAKKHVTLDGMNFVGYISNIELHKRLMSHDLFLHTSLEEACSTSVIEAMVSGLPVIAGIKSGGIPWELDYGKAGILVNVKDDNAIVNAIKVLINDPDKFNDLRLQGFEYCKKTFHPSIVVNQWSEKYLEVIKAGQIKRKIDNHE